MKKTILIILLFNSIIITAQSSFNSEDLKVTKSDLTINTYEKDSTANALVLYEQGNSYFDKKDFILKTEVKHKVKILNREGFDNANVKIYLYNDDNNNKKEKVEDIIATTYNLIDKVVITTRLKKADVFEEKYNDNTTLIKFTLPNIKEGSVIVYSYTLISPFMFKYKDWRFQDDIPKLYSEYRASIPGNWIFHKKLVGGKKLAVSTIEIKKDCLTTYNGGSADCEESVYAMKDIPAFISEDYMTAESNYLARIEYELETIRGMDGRISHYTKTWETVDKEFRTDGDIGRQLKKSVDAEKLLSQDIFNEPDTLKKAKAIFNYLQEDYTWNEKYRIFKDVSVKDLINDKSGNVSSINILLHNLLEESGIDVKPILLSTRNNGFATKLYPVISDFNYLIVQVTINKKTYFLDATDKYLSFGEIPFRCLNEYGRLLDFKEGSKWIDIKPSKKSSIMYNVDIHFDEEQNLVGKVKNRLTGYHALHAKKSYYPSEDGYLNKLENNSPFIEISNHEVTSKGKTSDKFSESYDIEYNIDEINQTLYLNPFIVKFFAENPFKLQERTYPIDFGYKDNYLYSFKLSLGENYSVKEMPKEIRLTLPNDAGNLSFASKMVGNDLHLLFKIDFKAPVYPAEYYPYLKELMSKIVDIQKNSLIVLNKT
ncbi:protein of unknown function [Flaviramulus basaltis]|uniref:Uncharacterized protein n=1 Tax=Flaviramulus basaltis TaxID=369401 RepID=A0A1K2IQB0_9FLAO|nr:DUF3857 domain-containing protein [Flaviramulus basaltis]SFZ94567.1 protein of unknown function [Flaviramulus basaltis]